MELAISKQGNSLYVPLPKSLSQRFNVKAGDMLTFETRDDGAWVIKPKSNRKQYDFETLLAEHEPEPYAWDNVAVGKEAL